MRNNQIKTGVAKCPHKRIFNALMPWLMIAGLAIALSGCGDSPQAQKNLGNANVNSSDYAGPAPGTEDTIAFRIEFWEKLRGSDRCGNCHGHDGQAPAFVDQTDVNLAYANAITVVNLADPASSRIVAKLREGHNCWTAPDLDACATIMEGYISAWAGGTGNVSGRQIDLTAPATIVDPGNSRSFPATAQTNGQNSFANTVYPLLRDNCSACHAETSASPQAPFFANADVNTAYQAAKAKMDLDTPANSRFVLRLRNEFHNCWSVCADDATEMESAIAAFSGAIALTQIDPALITSKAMRLGDAIIASGGSRYENNLIALWEFKTGSGTTAYDTSGVEPAMNLTLDPVTVEWVLGYGIQVKQVDVSGTIRNGRAYANTTSSKKLSDFIKSTGEYSIEAWIVPSNVTQEDSSIISYSGGGAVRNFTMGQSLYNYDFLNLSDKTDGTSMSKLMTDDADEDLQATLQHVVMNFDPVNGRRIYVNGVFTGDSDISADLQASIAGWNSNVAFSLGSEPGSNNGATQWQGKYRLAAIHNRVLSDAQILQNFNASVGQKYYMLFSIADRIGVPDSYIMFEVELYDNYSYLFSSPKFINLNPDWSPSMFSSIDIKGMRIGINGKEAVAGQAFANMDVTVSSGQYTVDGQSLSNLGTIISLEKGPDTDEFFLTFEQLGSATNTYVETDPVAPAAPADAEMVSKLGVRTFDEINATMSAITGVPITTASVSATFDTYRRQLPAVPDIQAYLSSHQMAVAQLAMSYCDELVDTAPGYFAGFNFALPPSTAFDDAGKNNILNPLLRAIMNVDTSTPSNNLGSQPDVDEVKAMLSSNSSLDLIENFEPSIASDDDYSSLIDCMTRCERSSSNAECEAYVNGGESASCSDDTSNNTVARTRQVVKATCAAMLGSAVMLIQ